jgi:hypothetical protein
MEKYSEKVGFCDYFRLNLGEKVEDSSFPIPHTAIFKFLENTKWVNLSSLWT